MEADEYTPEQIQAAQRQLDIRAADADYWDTPEGLQHLEVIEALDLQPAHNNLEGLQS